MNTSQYTPNIKSINGDVNRWRNAISTNPKIQIQKGFKRNPNFRKNSMPIINEKSGLQNKENLPPNFNNPPRNFSQMPQYRAIIINF